MITFDRLINRSYKFLNGAESLVQTNNTAPSIFLLSHALELSLKAFLFKTLCDSDVSLYKSKKYGHCLKSLYAEVISADLDKVISNQNELDLITKNYAEVYPNDVRYPETARLSQNLGSVEDMLGYDYISTEDEIDLISPDSAITRIKTLINEIGAQNA